MEGWVRATEEEGNRRGRQKLDIDWSG